VWARAWVISAGVIMNFLFAFITYTLVAAGWGFPEMQTTRIGVLDPSRVPSEAQALLDVPAGASIQEIGGEHVTHWGEVREAILNAPDGSTTVVFSDPSVEVQIELPDSELRAQVFDAMDFWLEPVIDLVTPGSPAGGAGIQHGDRVVAVDALEVSTWPQLVSAVRAKPEIPLELTVERDGLRLLIPVTPSAEPGLDPETGEMTTIGQIGVLAVLPEVAFSSMPALEAVSVGWRDTVFITRAIMGFLGQLVTGQVSPRNLGGIVAIGEMSGQAAAEGLPVFLRFMALFSVNLAVLNLLPIPVLDGGHLVFLGIEAIRGHPLSLKQRLRWSQVGFVVLMGVMALALGNDLLRLFGL
jgi:regulator of sigma E protease